MPRSRSASPDGFLPFMFPVLVDEPLEGGEWHHEAKYDGYPTQIVIREDGVRAYTRNRHDWTGRYGPVVEAASALRCRSAVLDGEMCVQDETGVTRFNALRAAIRNRPERLVFFAFDLMAQLRTVPARRGPDALRLSKGRSRT